MSTITFGTARKVSRIFSAADRHLKVVFQDPETGEASEGEARGIVLGESLVFPSASDDLADVSLWVTMGIVERVVHISEVVEDLDETFFILGER